MYLITIYTPADLGVAAKAMLEEEAATDEMCITFRCPLPPSEELSHFLDVLGHHTQVDQLELLKSPMLQDSATQDAIFHSWTSLPPNLCHLTIEQFSSLSPSASEALAKLLQGGEKLQSVRFLSTNIQNPAVVTLASLPQLESLTLNYCVNSAEAIQLLNQLVATADTAPLVFLELSGIKTVPLEGHDDPETISRALSKVLDDPIQKGYTIDESAYGYSHILNQLCRLYESSMRQDDRLEGLLQSHKTDMERLELATFGFGKDLLEALVTCLETIGTLTHVRVARHSFGENKAEEQRHSSNPIVEVLEEIETLVSDNRQLAGISL